MKAALGKQRILELLDKLNHELKQLGVRGELYLTGGAVMCLVYDARPATQDVDALFRPSAEIRKAASKVARSEALTDDWLNDAVKGYLSETAEFAPYLELSNLSVLTATAEYLLAMKCLAMRLGAEFHDESDVRYLLRFLNLTSYRKTRKILERFYPLDRYPQKTLYALEEMLPDR